MVLWFVGMSGSGKTFFSQKVYELLKPQVPNLVLLDGDLLREMYGGELNHTIEGRRKSHERFCQLSKFLSQQNIHVIAAALSIFHDLQVWNRTHLHDYTQIYLQVPLSLLKERDTKGLYSGATEGKIKNVVGMDIPFPEPIQNDLVIANHSREANAFEKHLAQVMSLPILQKLKSR